MIIPKTETEDLLPSFTNNCGTLIKQTHIKPQERPEFEPREPRETFSFKPSISLGSVFNWMIGLTSLEVYNSIYNLAEENNKFELYTDNFDEFSFEKLKDELEEIPNISAITPSHLQHEKIGPRINEEFKKLKLKKSSIDSYIMFLMGYARSPSRDFETYLRIVVDSDEDDIQLILKQHNSNFVNYGISPGIYTIKDIPEAVYTEGDHEKTLQIEYDDIRMKAKLIFTRFVGTFDTLRFNEKSFFNTLGFYTILGI